MNRYRQLKRSNLKHFIKTPEFIERAGNIEKWDEMFRGINEKNGTWNVLDVKHLKDKLVREKSKMDVSRQVLQQVSKLRGIKIVTTISSVCMNEGAGTARDNSNFYWL